MGKITKPIAREIIENFAQEIREKKTKGLPPTKTVIDFRNERRNGIEREIHYVPIDLLLYRKDNGRIASDILAYEKDNGILDEKTEEAQKIIREFLEHKDKEKTEELKRSIIHEGQREPAIITCDGFLINGNRRKMVMDKLSSSSKYCADERFKTMKAVILPGKDDVGGPPTLLEIEQIENRYQLQSDGKAEYYAFDRALSMRRKINFGMTLEEQLRDDPVYAGLDEKEFKKSIRKFEDDYIKPLECIDRYLSDHLKREGIYSLVSTGLGDSEGRWQAFYDYYNRVYKILSDEKKRITYKINENEVGKIEDAAFKIIRQRELKGLPKVHQIIRDLPKWLEHKDSRKELLKLNDIDHNLAPEECIDKHGNEHEPRDIDKIWASKHATEIIRQVKKAQKLCEHKEGRERPIDLLEDALKKLTHEDMDTSAVSHADMKKAMDLTKEIQKSAHDLEREFYHHIKNYTELPKKFKGN